MRGPGALLNPQSGVDRAADGELLSSTPGVQRDLASILFGPQAPVMLALSKVRVFDYETDIRTGAGCTGLYEQDHERAAYKSS